MKRFFKTGAACVLALALMSTSAFAAVTGGEAKFVDGKLNVTIEGTETSEQVALMVLKGEHKTTDVLASVKNTDIAYIDQKAGGASLAFSGINVGTENVVTVFAGSTNTASAILLGTATAKQYSLKANTASFNVAKGVDTLVNLALTNQDKQPVTDANVTYKAKDSADEFVPAGSLVRYVENEGWKFNFGNKGTYQVKFTKDGADAVVVVCVYEQNLPVTDIGKEGETAKPFVMKKAPDSTKVVAAVKVTINESQPGAGKLIWSITTADGAHYYSKSADWNTTGLSGALAIGCKFDNDTNSEVTAVNVIYKDATGKVFFTDANDAKNEKQSSSAE